jgi:hypothetical protein
MNRVKVLDKNTVVTCPACDQFIAIVKHDVYANDPMLANTFEFPTHQYKDGDMAVCFKCGKWWYDAKTTQIHTSKGWKPDVENK